MGQEFGPGLSRSSASGPLTRLPSRPWPERGSHLRLHWTKSCFSAHWSLAAFWSSGAAGLKASLPALLLARASLHPLPRGPNTAAHMTKATKLEGNRESANETEVSFYNFITKVTSIIFARFYSLKASCYIQPTLKGRGCTQEHEPQEVGSHGCHLSSPPTHLFSKEVVMEWK